MTACKAMQSWILTSACLLCLHKLSVMMGKTEWSIFEVRRMGACDCESVTEQCKMRSSIA